MQWESLNLHLPVPLKHLIYISKYLKSATEETLIDELLLLSICWLIVCDVAGWLGELSEKQEAAEQQIKQGADQTKPNHLQTPKQEVSTKVWQSQRRLCSCQELPQRPQEQTVIISKHQNHHDHSNKGEIFLCQ